MWHNVSTVMCIQKNYTDLNLLNGTFANLTSIVCGFNNAPSESQMTNANPYTLADSNNPICSECPTNLTECRNSLCTSTIAPPCSNEIDDNYFFCKGVD